MVGDVPIFQPVTPGQSCPWEASCGGGSATSPAWQALSMLFLEEGA